MLDAWTKNTKVRESERSQPPPLPPHHPRAAGSSWFPLVGFKKESWSCLQEVAELCTATLARRFFSRMPSTLLQELPGWFIESTLPEEYLCNYSLTLSFLKISWSTFAGSKATQKWQGWPDKTSERGRLMDERRRHGRKNGREGKKRNNSTEIVENIVYSKCYHRIAM